MLLCKLLLLLWGLLLLWLLVLVVWVPCPLLLWRLALLLPPALPLHLLLWLLWLLLKLLLMLKLLRLLLLLEGRLPGLLRLLCSPPCLLLLPHKAPLRQRGQHHGCAAGTRHRAVAT